MKLRSCLLLACMVVVPLLAMFSHRIPTELRAAVRRTVGDLWTRGTSAVAPTRPAAAAPRPPAAVASAPRAPTQAPAQVAGTSSLDTLARLGAVAVECQHLPGGVGGHVARCRVPVDAAGQLHRVFQAHGHDADAATQTLASAVASWKLAAGQPRPASLAADSPRF
jgi:hypothetical protein